MADKIKTEIITINNTKTAKKEIKRLIAESKLVLKQNSNFDRALENYEKAEKIAIEWDLIKKSEDLEDKIFSVFVQGLKANMDTLEKGAIKYAKEEDHNVTSQLYILAASVASEIFLLGVDGAIKDVKKFLQKAKEYEKLIS